MRVLAWKSDDGGYDAQAQARSRNGSAPLCAIKALQDSRSLLAGNAQTSTTSMVSAPLQMSAERVIERISLELTHIAARTGWSA
jgi:hypothetical protein